MNNELPKVSVVIPARPEQAEVKAANAARQLDYPPEKLEILIARGRHPSVQRNIAIRQASGEIIYFLDDDSIPPPDTLKKGIAHFRNADVAIVGGPNICPDDAPLIERVFAVILSSFIAFGPSRARYSRTGKIRETSEKELILCNMLARRDDLLKLGGFDENLYPNEENALMDELQKAGKKLIYDPDFFVFRRPRPNLKSFIKMLFNYGRGRAEQFRLHPTAGSILNFVPALFCIYCVLLLISLILSQQIFKIAVTPVYFYFAAILLQTLISIKDHGFKCGILALPLQILTHLSYGTGFLRGIFTSPAPPTNKISGAVTLEKITFT